MKKENSIFSKILSFFRVVIGTIGSYVGIMSNVLGAMLGILASVLVVCGIAGICIYVKVLPMFTEAREETFDKLVHMSKDDFIRTGETIIYDAKGKKAGSVNKGRYQYVKIKNISPYIYNGYIAVEDKRFKTHGGVDVLATMRAGVSLLRNNMEIKQGGSTITQQVVKNNLLTQHKSYTRKIAEIFLAPAVEAEFSKDKIMEFYCNSNYYGNRCYGVEAASRYYFGCKSADLEPQEAALLIGLSNSPGRYDPVANPANALKKRNEVLRIMRKEKVITQKEYEVAVKKKLKILQLVESGKKENYITGYAIHCAALALMEKENFKFQYTFADKNAYETYQKRYAKVYGDKIEEIRSGGYKLYTSIDMSKQKKLQKAVDEGLSFNREKGEDGTRYALQGAAVCVDNTSNYVVAIVGGRGTKDVYNRAYLSARQSGSSIKPLIDYTPGFESGMFAPATVVKDCEIPNGPKNASGSYRGNVMIREAVARSINTIAWQVLEAITPKYGLSFLDKMHFNHLSYVDNDNLALSLGGFTEGVRVVDMAKGYATLANGGMYSDRTCIVKINHISDGTIYNNTEQTSRVYSEDASWMMTDVLKGVLNEPYGTGRALRLDNKQIAAGKTGTANAGKDVWFCGYTKYYTTVVWAGYDTPRAMPGASGAAISGRIWKNYMNQIHVKKKPADFLPPDSICLASYDSSGNMISGTEESGSKARVSGKDYFSKKIMKDTAGNVAKLKKKNANRILLKKLRYFEAMTINSVSEYYAFDQLYEELRDLIAAMTDEDLRKSYATRAKNKFDSMKKEKVEWAKVAREYEAAKKAENELLVRQNQENSQKAREKELHSSRVALAKAKIRKLRTFSVWPANGDALIAEAMAALNACSSYSEYAQLKSLYDTNVAYIKGLKQKSMVSSAISDVNNIQVKKDKNKNTTKEDQKGR